MVNEVGQDGPESGSVPGSALPPIQAGGESVVVPDAQLLVTADYSRIGDDLLLKGADGSTLLVEGYFAADPAPALMAPSGATLWPDQVAKLVGPMAPGQIAQAGPVDGQQPIGQVEEVTGDVVAVRGGVATGLNVGDPVFQDDVVQTGLGSELVVGFADGTIFTLSENARMTLDGMVYDPDGDANSLVTSVIHGGFSFITGQIAPTGEMLVDTPIATIGIRGTFVNCFGRSIGDDLSCNASTSQGGATDTVTYERRDTGEPVASLTDPTSVYTIDPQLAVRLRGLDPSEQLVLIDLLEKLGTLQASFLFFFDPDQPIFQPVPARRAEAEPTIQSSGSPFQSLEEALAEGSDTEIVDGVEGLDPLKNNTPPPPPPGPPGNPTDPTTSADLVESNTPPDDVDVKVEAEFVEDPPFTFPNGGTNGEASPGNGAGGSPNGTAPELAVTTTESGAALVDAILGSGITVVPGSITYAGAPLASGLFVGGLSSGIGIESGIILTSGNADLAVGPNVDDGATGDNDLPGDSDLDGLIPQDTFDATILEFDFTTEGGDLFFNFVFASEEYNEFAFSGVNDVFGFFLDGVNIGVIPGTTTPVSIDNVNGGNPFESGNAVNSNFFNNNDRDDGGPFFNIEYDGFTNVFTASATGLAPGVHSIKLAIADAGDTVLDSAVFIQGGSFSDQVTTGFGAGFLYEFQVGADAITPADNIRGTDLEDGVTTQFTITTLPAVGLLLIDRNDDGVIDQVFGGTFGSLPAGGVDVQTGDSVFYFLPQSDFADRPESVMFNYFTTDSGGLTSDGATVMVNLPNDTPAVISAEDQNVDEDDIVGPLDGAEVVAASASASASDQEPGSDLVGEVAAEVFGLFGLPFDPPPSDAPAAATGTISVDFGFDQLGSVAFTQATVDALTALGLTSSTIKDEAGNDQPLSYAISPGGEALVGFVDVDGDGAFSPEGDHVAFTALLEPPSSSGEFTYKFALFGSINHPDGGGENSIALPFSFQVTDVNGDTAQGSFDVSVVDDVPTIAPVIVDGGEVVPQPTELSVRESDIGDEGGAMDMTTATVVFGADGAQMQGDPVKLTLTGARALPFSLEDGDDTPVNDDEVGFVINPDGTTTLTSMGIPVQIRMEGPTKIVGFIEVPLGDVQVNVFTYDEYYSGGGTKEEIVFEAFLEAGDEARFGVDSVKFVFEQLKAIDHPDGMDMDVAEGAGPFGETGSQDQIELTFGVTVQDDDLDTDTLTLTVRIDDDGPRVLEQAPAIVDEDGLSDGIPGGPGDAADANLDNDNNEATFSGVLNYDFGADRPGDVFFDPYNEFETGGLQVCDADGQPIAQLFSRGDPVSFTFGSDNRSLIGLAGGREVIKVEITDILTGAYEVTLLDQLDHPDPGPGTPGPAVEDDIVLKLPFIVADFDGDKAEGTLEIVVNDDTPAVVDGGKSVAATVLEDGLNADVDEPPAGPDGNDQSTGNRESGELDTDDEASGGPGTLSALFAAGADDPLASVGLSNDLSMLPRLFSQGVELNYAVDGGTLTATAAGRPVFTLVVNPDGSYSFDLDDQLDHVAGDGGNAELRALTPGGEPTSLPFIDFSSVVRAIDFDGDLVSLDSESFTIRVIDDAPVASGTMEMGVVEEEQLPGGNEDTLAPEDLDVEEAESFTDITTDTISGSVAGLVSFGADDPAAGGGFDLSGGVAGLTAQGLTSQGEALVYGVDGTTLTATAGERSVFTLELQPNGDYTFTLLDRLDHAPGAGENVLAIDFSSLVRATDFDGDTGTLQGSTFTVKVIDDVPIIGGGEDSALVVQERLIEDIASTTLGVRFGADGPNQDMAALTLRFVPPAIDVAESLGETQMGLPALTTPDGDTVNVANIDDLTVIGFVDGAAGTPEVFDEQTDTAVFRATFNSTTGQFGFTLLEALAHPDVGEALGSDRIRLNFDLTAKDGDGDTAARRVAVDIEDDTPQAVQPDVVMVDEDDLTPPLAGTSTFDGNDLPPAEKLTATGGIGIAFGADGPRDITDVNLTAPLFSQGAAVTLMRVGTSDTYVGQAAGRDVFSLDFDVEVGTYTFTLLDNLDHPPGGGKNTLSIVFRVFATDGDFDIVSGPITVNVIDDAPVANDNMVMGTVEEEQLSGGNEDTFPAEDLDMDGGEPGFQDNTTDVVSGTVATLVSFGADGPAAGGGFSLTADTSGLVPLTSQGETVLYGVAGNTLTATAGERTVFTLELLSDGGYTFTLLDRLDHAPGEGENLLTIDFSSIVRATDFDGDPILLDQGQFTIKVIDDTPLIDNNEVGVTHDETLGVDLDADDRELPPGLAAVVAALAGAPVIGSAQSAASVVTVQIGADDPARMSLTDASGGSLLGVDSGLMRSSDNLDIYLFSHPLDSRVVVGNAGTDPAAAAGGEIVFALFIDDRDNTLWVAQFDGVEHPIASNPDDPVSMANKVFVTVTDGDGDSATTTQAVAVSFQDDGPGVAAVESIHDETPGVDPLSDDTGDALPVEITAIIAAEPINTSKKTIAFDFGADGPGGIALDDVVNGTPSGLFDTATMEEILLFNGPDDTVVGLVGGVEGAVAFVAFIDPSGVVEGPDNASTADLWFAQYRAIKHDNPFDPDEANPEPEIAQGPQDIITFEGLATGTWAGTADDGTDVFKVFAQGGGGPILVSGLNPDVEGNAAVIFDAGNPSGGLEALGAPNEDFGGPGVGASGEAGSPFQNDTPLGKTLIIGRGGTLVDGNGDGLIDVPRVQGLIQTTLVFDFSSFGSVRLDSITAVDIGGPVVPGSEFPVPQTITFNLFDATDTLITSIPGNMSGDNATANGVDVVDLGGTSGVVRMEVVINGSGSVDNIVFQPDPIAPEDEVVSLAYTVTDADGDTASAIAAITVEDDGPAAADDPAAYLQAGETVGGNVLANGDDPGVDGTADGGPLTLSSFRFFGEDEFGHDEDASVAPGTTATTFFGGALIVNADGTWAYEAPTSVPGETLEAFDLDAGLAGYVDDFTYVIEDGDGDHGVGSQPIRVVLDPSRAQFGDVGADTLTGGADVDFISGGDDDDMIDGGGGADLLFGDGGDDLLDGGDGNDVLFGDSGDDVLNGDAGEDLLFGGLGDDDMTGGLDADIYDFTLRLNEGADEILDFSGSPGGDGDMLSFTDVVDVDGDGDIDINDAVSSFSQSGTTVNITLHSGTTIVINDIDNVLNSLSDLNDNSVIN